MVDMDISTISETTDDKSITYDSASAKFTSAWNAGQQAAKEASDSLVDMLTVLEAQKYTRTAAVNKIVEDHKNLTGFSRATLYRNLPAEVRREYHDKPLLDESSSKQTLTSRPNVSRETFESDSKNIHTDNKSIQSEKTTVTVGTTKELADKQEAEQTNKVDIHEQKPLTGEIKFYPGQYRGTLFSAMNNNTAVLMQVENGQVVNMVAENMVKRK